MDSAQPREPANRRPLSGDPVADIRLLIRERRKAQALDVLWQSLDRREAPSGGWQEILQLAQDLGDDDAALKAAQACLGERPGDARLLENRIEILERLGRSEEALDEAVALQSVPGGEAAGLFHEGIGLARRGERDASISALKAALKADPKRTQCWDYITVQKTFSAGDRDFLRLQNDYGRLAVGDANVLAPVIHALGKANDDMGRTERAFEKFREVGQLMRRFQAYDVGGPVKYCERLASTFSRDFFRRTRVSGCSDETPVFIIGPPRSGTTLLERMLSTHPDITAGGEHTLLRVATYQLGNLEPFELRDAFGRNREIFAECGRTYVDRVKARFGTSKRITDKTPINHFFVGVLNIMLPNARYIWARRDLRDTAWSCFRTRLSGNRWTEDIEDTVAYLAAYDGLMRHWKDVMGDRLLVVDYERLVEDPGPLVDAVQDHVGVDRHDGWREFHETDGAVSTASLSQVRDPLNTKSVGAWRKYEKFLKRAFEAFDQ